MPRKKPKTQTTEESERDLAIKRDKMKLLREQRKLQNNNKELTFEEDQEPPIQKNKEEELERQREQMRLLHSRRQLNCEAKPSSNVEVISSSHVEETLIYRSDDIHTPSCHVESTTSTHQVGDIPSFTSYCQGTSSSVQGMQNTQSYVDVQNVEGMEEIITPSRICFRRPKYLIDTDTNILKSIADKISKCTC